MILSNRLLGVVHYVAMRLRTCLLCQVGRVSRWRLTGLGGFIVLFFSLVGSSTAGRNGGARLTTRMGTKRPLEPGQAPAADPTRWACVTRSASPPHSRLLSLVLFCFIMLASCNEAPVPAIELTGVLPVSAPTTISAGEPLKVQVGPVHAKDGIIITLIADGSYGPRVYQAPLQQGWARLILPALDTRQSGVVILTAQAGRASGKTLLTVLPRQAIEPVTPLVGARAIIADAQHWSMAVLVPFDVYGNPVSEGTRVDVTVLHPSNRLEKKVLAIRHLLAWTRVFSRTTAGRTTIIAHLGPVHGPESTLLEVAGWPVRFTLSAAPRPLSADGRLLTTLSTAVIRDKFGNMMPDGTLVTFVIEERDGSRSYIPAYTINGVAEAPMQAPRIAGKVKIHAVVLGVESATYLLVFTPGPAVGTFPLRLKKAPREKLMLLRAGPMLGPLGQYIPDGTPVRFRVANKTGQVVWFDGVSDGGYASVELRPAQFPPGTYTAQAIAGSGHGTLKFTLS